MTAPKTVQTTVLTQARGSGLIVPKGTIGRVIGLQQTDQLTNNLVVDFGLFHVVILPVDSPIIKVKEQQ